MAKSQIFWPCTKNETTVAIIWVLEHDYSVKSYWIGIEILGANRLSEIQILFHQGLYVSQPALWILPRSLLATSLSCCKMNVTWDIEMCPYMSMSPHFGPLTLSHFGELWSGETAHHRPTPLLSSHLDPEKRPRTEWRYSLHPAWIGMEILIWSIINE